MSARCIDLASSRHSRASNISIASGMLRTAYAVQDSTPGAPSRDDSTPPRKEDYCGHRLDENPRRERTVKVLVSLVTKRSSSARIVPEM